MKEKKEQTTSEQATSEQANEIIQDNAQSTENDVMAEYERLLRNLKFNELKADDFVHASDIETLLEVYRGAHLIYWGKIKELVEASPTEYIEESDIKHASLEGTFFVRMYKLKETAMKSLRGMKKLLGDKWCAACAFADRVGMGENSCECCPIDWSKVASPADECIRIEMGICDSDCTCLEGSPYNRLCTGIKETDFNAAYRKVISLIDDVLHIQWLSTYEMIDTHDSFCKMLVDTNNPKAGMFKVSIGEAHKALYRMLNQLVSYNTELLIEGYSSNTLYIKNTVTDCDEFGVACTTKKDTINIDYTLLMQHAKSLMIPQLQSLLGTSQEFICEYSKQRCQRDGDFSASACREHCPVDWQGSGYTCTCKFDNGSPLYDIMFKKYKEPEVKELLKAVQDASEAMLNLQFKDADSTVVYIPCL